MVDMPSNFEAFDPPIPGMTYHTVQEWKIGFPMVFRVDVFVNGFCGGVDPDTGEPFLYGGKRIATVYRRSMIEATMAGIKYSRYF